ncbi:helix-turn-helix domain-containing protein [Dethiosulfovibrio salsuginis]|nr:helix-turn-helix transcriptional regulator [Dethiosulfovibrio salsuginis]
MSIGTRIREARNSRGWSQAKLAEKAGVHPVTLSTWENGEKPSLSSLEKLAVALEIPVGFLLEGENRDVSEPTKPSTGILQAMREQTGLSIEEAAALIHLPAEDLEMMEIHEEKADDALKDKLIKAYGKYLAERDGDIQGMGSKPKKGQSEEDLETLLKMLAAEDPDIVLRFRHVAKNATRLAPEDREFLATLFKAALGKITLEDHTDEY